MRTHPPIKPAHDIALGTAITPVPRATHKDDTIETFKLEFDQFEKVLPIQLLDPRSAELNLLGSNLG